MGYTPVYTCIVMFVKHMQLVVANICDLSYEPCMEAGLPKVLRTISVMRICKLGKIMWYKQLH